MGNLKGIVCAVLAAVFYGANPFALFLYKEGVSSDSVLFYRYFAAAVILGAVLVFRGGGLSAALRECAGFACLGAVFAFSSLSLFVSFNYMDAGIASTILFVYPVFVAVIMSVCFREKFSARLAVSMGSALAGVCLLCDWHGGNFSFFGIFLVLVSSLLYAIYIVAVNRFFPNASALKLTFYVLVSATITIVAEVYLRGGHLQMLPSAHAAFWALFLAVVPTVASLVLAAVAIRLLGATQTAVVGALEPLTAVVIGVGVFGEKLNFSICAGIVLIVAAVFIVVLQKSGRQAKQKNRF